MKPAVSLAAVPGRRRATVELARRLEDDGFAGIYCPSLGDGLALCEAIALTTERIPFGTSITPIYTRHTTDLAHTVAFIHEISSGRFRFGVGVSHGPVHDRLGVKPGAPLADMRRFVAELRETEHAGELPPIVLAALRDRMIRLGGEIADGIVFANGARSHMAHSLGQLPAAQRDDPEFFIGDMIPTVIADDEEEAKAVHRRTLARYVQLPNYRNYWRAAGYAEEMDAIERAIDEDESHRLPALMSDRWLADCTLYGPAAKVRDGVEAWREAGIRTPILVPSSTAGGQMKAFEELFAAFS